MPPLNIKTLAIKPTSELDQARGGLQPLDYELSIATALVAKWERAREVLEPLAEISVTDAATLAALLPMLAEAEGHVTRLSSDRAALVERIAGLESAAAEQLRAEVAAKHRALKVERIICAKRIDDLFAELTAAAQQYFDLGHALWDEGAFNGLGADSIQSTVRPEAGVMRAVPPALRQIVPALQSVFEHRKMGPAEVGRWGLPDTASTPAPRAA
jgi:hypothetical protein